MNHPLSLSQLCEYLKLPLVAQKAELLADRHSEQQQPYLSYIIELLQIQWEARWESRLKRLLKQAQFPVQKTLASFNFERTPSISEKKINQLADNRYIANAEPILLMGEPGTGKTHLATALGMAAIHGDFKVRFITIAQLATQLMEAKDERTLSLVMKRYTDVDVLILDELGYFPVTQAHAELIFQILSTRQERKPVIVTSNLPFSEWHSVFPEPRLCKAATDRLTHKAHIINTGTESVRLAETLSNQEG